MFVAHCLSFSQQQLQYHDVPEIKMAPSCVTCRSFFTLLVLSRFEACATMVETKLTFLKSLEMQMESLETELSVFISGPKLKSIDPCFKMFNDTNRLALERLPHLKFAWVNDSQLFEEEEISEAASFIINSWSPMEGEDARRKADIFRLCLARKYRSTYVGLLQNGQNARKRTLPVVACWFSC
jgi:hypothetical protein